MANWKWIIVAGMVVLAPATIKEAVQNKDNQTDFLYYTKIMQETARIEQYISKVKNSDPITAYQNTLFSYRDNLKELGDYTKIKICDEELIKNYSFVISCLDEKIKNADAKGFENWPGLKKEINRKLKKEKILVKINQ